MRSRRLLTQKLNRYPTWPSSQTTAASEAKRIEQLLSLVADPLSLDTLVGYAVSHYADLIEDRASDRPEERTALGLVTASSRLRSIS